MSPDDDQKLEWFKLMCQSSPDFMVIVDRQRRFRWVNRLYPGLTLADVIGQPLENFEHPDTHERSRAATERAFETGDVQGFESHVALPDERHAWYQVRCIPIADHANRLLIVSTDVTARKAAEAERDLYRQKLFQSQKMEALGRLAGGIAHDFNNLLTPILAYAERAMASLADDDPAQQSLNGVCEAATRAAELTDQLLTIGRGREHRAHAIDLAHLVRGMERMLRRVVPEHVHLDVDAVEEGACAWADPGRLEQVFLNLVLNASDAMPQGGEIHIRTGVDDGDAVLSVQDSGVGMSAETLEHLFEPFFSTKGAHGTGLGLATAHSIVDESGGTLEVKSQPGVGTTFRVVLPLHRGTPTSAPRPADSLPRPMLGDLEATVLVVEDADLVRTIVVEQLRSAGCRVLEAASGAEALAHSAEVPSGALDLLLSDVVLPGMPGPEVARSVRARHPDVRILFMSGHPRDLLRDVDLPGARLLRKPFTSTQLLSEVNAAIRPCPRSTV